VMRERGSTKIGRGTKTQWFWTSLITTIRNWITENTYTYLKPAFSTGSEVIMCELYGQKCKTFQEFNQLLEPYTNNWSFWGFLPASAAYPIRISRVVNLALLAAIGIDVAESSYDLFLRRVIDGKFHV
jgi:hypothetical protein